MYATKLLMSLKAADLMSRNVVMLSQEMSLQLAARLLARAGVTGAPVVDDRGQCVGVLSATDFMHSVEHERKSAGSGDCFKAWQQVPEGDVSGCRVADCMTPDPVLVTPDVRIGELARMMMDAHIHRIIVVDGPTNRPVGVVSSMDLLAAVARAEQPAEEPEVGVAMAEANY
jgi:predicted transcriptional regulator